jgi:ectoine hydroxylase
MKRAKDVLNSKEAHNTALNTRYSTEPKDHMPECLHQDQIDHDRREGFVVLERHIPESLLGALSEELQELQHQAHDLTASNHVFDLEETHTPENPRVRRIKKPHRHSPLLNELMRSDYILGPVRDLLGPNVRLQDTKLNIKSAHYGAAVEWHQDWAYYPYTNDDIVSVGLLLDTVTMENAPLQVIPQTHTGPIYNHHDATRGYFVGAMNAKDLETTTNSAVSLVGPAGTITLHHVRLVHGSALNVSLHDRRMIFFELLAADAFPIAGSRGEYSTWEEFESRMLCGVSTQEPRLSGSCPVRLPLPAPPKSVGSLYDYQSQMEASQRSFQVIPKK